MNKKTVNDVRLMNMHASELKAYSDVLELKNYLPNMPALQNLLAMHFPDGGGEILSIEKLPRATESNITMNYTLVSKEHLSKIQSPLDKL